MSLFPARSTISGNPLNGRIDILIERGGDGEASLFESGDLLPIENFIVSDNGIGFTDPNYDAFNPNVDYVFIS